VQTFLPYPSFAKSARILDDRRLGKQRVEALQLLNALTGKSRGWTNHPATKMWRGHEDMLVLYGLVVTREWKRRGFKDTCFEKIGAFLQEGKRRRRRKLRRSRPPWLGDERFHRSHQAALARKRPEHYRRFFPDVDDTLAYHWPSDPAAT
jgi:hypothetical protein